MPVQTKKNDLLENLSNPRWPYMLYVYVFMMYDFRKSSVAYLNTLEFAQYMNCHFENLEHSSALCICLHLYSLVNPYTNTRPQNRRQCNFSCNNWSQYYI